MRTESLPNYLPCIYIGSEGVVLCLKLPRMSHVAPSTTAHTYGACPSAPASSTPPPHHPKQLVPTSWRGRFISWQLYRELPRVVPRLSGLTGALAHFTILRGYNYNTSRGNWWPWSNIGHSWVQQKHCSLPISLLHLVHMPVVSKTVQFN